MTAPLLGRGWRIAVLAVALAAACRSGKRAAAASQLFRIEPVRPAAEALVRAHRALGRHGYGAMVYDAYRPWSVTWVFWEATPSNLHEFVADAAQGSRHNRGCAVELGLYELVSGAFVAPERLDDSERAGAYFRHSTGTAGVWGEER
jgi:D-alanyl-D-alanine dipeptidase